MTTEVQLAIIAVVSTLIVNLFGWLKMVADVRKNINQNGEKIDNLHKSVVGVQKTVIDKHESIQESVAKVQESVADINESVAGKMHDENMKLQERLIIARVSPPENIDKLDK